MNQKYEKIPTWLKHRPYYKIENYYEIDCGDKKTTDVIGMSIGEAQWKKLSFAPSVKIWRQAKSDNGEYFISRQSEETTLTRALDMATFVLKIYAKYKIQKNSDNIIFDKLKIDESEDCSLEKDLELYFNDKDNVKNLEKHIAFLLNEIKNIQ